MKRWLREDGTERSLWLDIGAGSFLAVEQVESGTHGTDASTGWHCVALSIPPEQREAWVIRLAESGHPVERETEYTIYVRDPEGALVGLSHYPSTKPSTKPSMK